MARVLVTESYISDIASAIRSKNGQSASYTPSQMASAIDSIISAGALSIISKSILSNGTYSAEGDNADAFLSVVVDVPNTYTAGDEGKVVVEGSLIAQGSMSVSSNSTYDTTLYSQIVVDVPSAYMSIISKTISANGTYNPSDDSADAYSQVVVNVSGGGGGSYDNYLIAIGAKSGVIEDSTASKIGSFAFYRRSSNQGIDQPITGIIANSVKIIEASAFYSCANMSIASFPLCEEIKHYAFKGCASLETISCPSCSKMGDGIFDECFSLAKAEFPLISSISVSVFGSCYSLSYVSFPICEYIGSYAFSGCRSLTSVYFPSCSSMNINAFYYCSALVSADFPLCKTIGGYAFQNCSVLRDISFPLCSSIGTQAFANCSSLSTASFPLCETIHQYAFASCKSLFSLYLLGGSVATLMSNNVFNWTPFSNSSYYGEWGSIFVPESLVDSYKAANNWSYYSDRIVGV